MHRDERPGGIPGWGPVTADVARAMVDRQHRAEWRFAVTDPTGYLVLAGLTRRRPRGAGDTARECRGGIVELHVPAALLVELAAAPTSSGPWAAVVADIAGQYARRHRHQRMLDARPDDRFANALLRRHVQVRDRTCVAPGCCRPARRCDQDHTLDHELGGLTVAGNSGPLCRRHHRMKHEGRWRLEQPRPGHFVWTSPLRQIYRTGANPSVHPSPTPHPATPHRTPTSTRWRDGLPIPGRSCGGRHPSHHPSRHLRHHGVSRTTTNLPSDAETDAEVRTTASTMPSTTPH